MGSQRAWVPCAAGLLRAGTVTIGLLWAGTGCTPKGTPAAPTAAAPLDAQPAGPDWFEDVTTASGIDFTSRNGEEGQPPHLAILESLGGGVGLIDYDGDGLLDVFLPGGGRLRRAGQQGHRRPPVQAVPQPRRRASSRT